MPHRRIPRNAFLLLSVGFVVLCIGGGARFAISLTFKPMVEELEWTRSELGAAITLFQVISAGCMFAAGKLADLVQPRLVLTVGLLMSAVGIGMMCVITAPWHALIFYGLLFAIGNGIASITPITVLITAAFPGRIGLANAVAASGLSVGHIVVVGLLAAVLGTIGWRSVFLWVGAAHLVVLPLLFAAIPKGQQLRSGERPLVLQGLSIREASRRRELWLLLAIYAICGFDDFFVATHLVAFAQDRGIDAFLAGNLLALMGVTGLLGVLAAGAANDRAGPIFPTAASFAARVVACALIAVDQSVLSVVVFAVVFGGTFLVTAPLTIVFVKDLFGTKHIGSLTGLIFMTHHVSGGIGAYVGALIFDTTERYDAVFTIMLIISSLALVLTLCLKGRLALGVQR